MTEPRTGTYQLMKKHFERIGYITADQAWKKYRLSAMRFHNVISYMRYKKHMNITCNHVNRISYFYWEDFRIG